jgi:hypothetical protein
MRIAISAAALLLFLGTSSVYAQQDKPQDNHQQGDHPKTNHQQSGHQQGRPQQKGAKPAQQHAKPAPTHTQRTARPHQQPSARPQQHPMNREQRASARPAPHAHGRISDAHYRASFGNQHRFHVSRGDYQHHMFRYGGYSFRFVDPWPPAWAYSDPVYVVYLDGGYYMYDPVHPGIRLSLSIF